MMFLSPSSSAIELTDELYPVPTTLYGHISQNMGRQTALGYQTNLILDREVYNERSPTPFAFPGPVALDLSSHQLSAAEKRILLKVAQDEEYRVSPFGRRTWFPEVPGAAQAPNYEQSYSVAVIEGHYLSLTTELSRFEPWPFPEELHQKLIRGLVSGIAELVDFKAPIFVVTKVRYLGQLKAGGFLGFGSDEIRDVVGNRQLFPGDHPSLSASSD